MKYSEDQRRQPIVLQNFASGMIAIYGLRQMSCKVFDMNKTRKWVCLIQILF